MKLQAERDELDKANVFLDTRLTETNNMLTVIEEERRHDQAELQTMREQLQTFQREYVFYKQLAERLEAKQGEELEVLNAELRQLREREKDLLMRCEAVERENGDL